MTGNGDTVFSEEQWEAIRDRLNLPDRQYQVIRQLFAGQSDKQIANEMGVALPTVRSHLQRIFAKFEVQDRTELVLYIVRDFIRVNGIAHDDIAHNDITNNDN